LFAPNQPHIRGLDHGIGRLNGSYETLGLDQAKSASRLARCRRVVHLQFSSLLEWN
jgi:hypothetical protein